MSSHTGHVVISLALGTATKASGSSGAYGQVGSASQSGAMGGPSTVLTGKGSPMRHCSLGSHDLASHTRKLHKE